MLTQSRLKKVLEYDPETGCFTRIIGGHGVVSGSVANSINSGGYLRTNIDGVGYRLHRLVFLYLYGEFPPDQVDHINGDRSDNRRINLRRCDGSINNKNMCKPIDNTSGVVGVTWNMKSNKWQAQIKANGHYKYLGLFADKEDAIAARQAAETKYDFHKNHGRKSQHYKH